MRAGRKTDEDFIPIFSFAEDDTGQPDAPDTQGTSGTPGADGRHDPPVTGGAEADQLLDSGWNGARRVHERHGRHGRDGRDIPQLFEERPRRTWLVVAGLLVCFVAGAFVGAALGGRRSVEAEGAGPEMYVNGIPEGFSADVAGATAAATSYVTLLGTPWIDDPDTYLGLYDKIAAPGARSALEKSASRAIEALEREREAIGATAEDTLVLRSYPLATHVDGSTGVAATVRVWALTVLAVDGVLAPRSGWVVYTLSLLYESGTWKVAQLAAEPQGAGPDGGEPEDKSLPEILTDFKPLLVEDQSQVEGQP
jgi:hypothetical protein